MNIVALDIEPICFGGLDLAGALSNFGALTTYADTPPELVVERAAGAELVLTNKVPLTAESLACLPKLRAIFVLATGYNIVDVKAAAARGIAVHNVKGYAKDSVAQHVWAMVLSLANRVSEHAADVATGGWHASWCRQVAPVIGLSGKRLGIVGHGDIGKAVAHIGRAFGMEVLIGEVPGRSYQDFGRRSVAQLVRESDVISLHCPLTPETEQFVNASFLGGMKSDALLVNTSRGGLIDEPALADALRHGRIGHALLDVLSVEPPPADHVLLSADVLQTGRITITGHYAWTTPQARQLLINETAENIRAFLEGASRNRVRV